MTKPTFRGKSDPNAILRGETKVRPGDTFIVEDGRMKGFTAFRYTPQTPEPPRAHMHFTFLGRGSLDTCRKACRRGVQQ